MFDIAWLIIRVWAAMVLIALPIGIAVFFFDKVAFSKMRPKQKYPKEFF